MEISSRIKVFGTAINELRRLVGATQPSVIPAASMLLFSADPEKGLTITGTDLETEQVYYFPEIRLSERESALIPAKKFFDICKLFEEDKEICMKLGEKKSEIEVDGAHYELNSMPADEFPEFAKKEDGFSITISLSELFHLISKTLFSMPQNDARYYLNGLFLEVKNGHLVAVTTDGHRLSLAKTPIKDKPKDDQNINVILPAKLASCLSDILSGRDGEATATLCSSQAHFQFSDMEISTKVIEGTYPNYEKILPKDLPKKINVDKSELKRNLRRITAISNGESSFGASFNFNEEALKMVAKNKNQERVELQQTIKDNKDKLEIAFNVYYLSDILSVIDSSEILCEFKDNQSTAQFREESSDSTLYIVMPLRV